MNKEERFENCLREELTEKEFWEYVKDTLSVDEFCRLEVDSFINLDEKQQKERLKIIKSYHKKPSKKKELKERLRDYLREKDKTMGAVDTEVIIKDLKTTQKEFDKVAMELLQAGEIYEPKPCWLRWLG